MVTMYRQGDVLLVATEATPSGKKVKAEAGRLILARGEATGHHHSVSARNATMFDEAGKFLLVVADQATLDHQEHSAIEVAPGAYWVVRQREYTPEEIRRVQD